MLFSATQCVSNDAYSLFVYESLLSPSRVSERFCGRGFGDVFTGALSEALDEEEEVTRKKIIPTETPSRTI